MTLKVSYKHPHFPDDYVFGLTGVGQLKNDGTPVEVDEEVFQRKMGVSLEEAFANDAHVTIEGANKASETPDVVAPSEEEGSE